jgi:hypothetical protein
MTKHRSSLSRALLLASVAIVAGCTVGPDFKQPDKPKEQGYTPESLAPQTAAAPGAEGGAAQSFTATFPATGGRCSVRRSSRRW